MFTTLLLGTLLAAIGVLISLWSSSVQQAHQILGFVLLGLFLIPVGVLQLLPHVWRERLVEMLMEVGILPVTLLVVATLTLLDVLLLAFVRTRFRRGRLIT